MWSLHCVHSELQCRTNIVISPYSWPAIAEMKYKNLITLYISTKMPFTPHLHDFDDLRTFVLFVVTIYTLFSAKFLGLKNSHRQLIRFSDVWFLTLANVKFTNSLSWNLKNSIIYHFHKFLWGMLPPKKLTSSTHMLTFKTLNIFS